jgi:uncharacterized protein (DUF1697 family)
MRACAFLRAINVSGRNMIKMAHLCDLFKEAGCTSVTTYLQSGNVIFDYSRKLSGFDAILEKAVAARFSLDVPVIIRTLDEIASFEQRNSLLKKSADLSLLHVTMFKNLIDTGATEKLAAKQAGDEAFVVDGREVFLYCPHGYGTTKLNNANLEKICGQEGTTRSWKTIRAVSDL